jgi:saccharopine dehydrogenase (NAD+, L-lysine-forming)
MSRVLVLGAAGGVGGVAARALATVEDVGLLVVADQDAAAVRQLAAELDPTGSRVVGSGVDVADPASLAAALAGADLVVNCVGPFFRFGPPTLRAAIAAGVDYVDVCDDLDPTREMLALDTAAKEAGVRALIGMGNSPGVANVLVRLCAETLLDRVEAVDIMHVHGGEPDEGAAVIHHRIHAMTNDVPLFVDGAFVTVRQLEESGQAFVREADFRDVGRLPVFPYPHPETITLPQHVPGLRRATNLGVITPLAYFRLTQDLVRAADPAAGFDDVVARLQAERPRLLAEAGLTGPVGCLRVSVTGEKGGDPHGYVFQLSSRSAGAGEGTGIPAAAGAALMLRGEAGTPGVLPPEAAVSPGPFLALAFDLLGRLGTDQHAGTSIVVEHTGPDGDVDLLPIG